MGRDDETTCDRLLQMFELGIAKMAANLRRQHPAAFPERIEQLLEEWLAARPDPDVDDRAAGPLLATLR